MSGKSKANKRRPRTSKTYQNKIRKVKKWHEKAEEARKKWSPERLAKAKELKPLQFYIDQLRKPC